MRKENRIPKAGTPEPDRPPAAGAAPLDLDDAVGLVNTGDRVYQRVEEAGKPLVNDHHRYREYQELGAGGVGKVRSCLDPHLGRVVALKSLHPELVNNVTQRARFVREARVMAQLEHPNIVPIHELGMSESGAVYFTMKRVKGISLHDIFKGLEDGDPALTAVYTCDYLMDLFVQICQAVAFAHSRRVIHRDLKPANILIGDFGEVLIMDWGLAKMLDDPRESVPGMEVPEAGQPAAARTGDNTVTMDGAISGTPVYMSPEQARGQNSMLDDRSDIYSLGTILYEILTGQHTVYGFNVEDTIERVLNGRIIPPRKREGNKCVNRELDAICMKALQKNRSDRYFSVPDLIQDLQNARRGLPVSARPDSRLRRAWKWCRRHPIISSTATAAFTVLMAGLLLYGASTFLRYEELMRTGDRHREKGSNFFNEKIEVYRKLVGLRQQRTAKTKSPAEEELDARLNTLHQLSENEYDTAVILYMMASDNLDNVRHQQAMRKIFGNRIDYSLMTRNWSEVDRWLEFARNWLGPNFEKADPVSRGNLLSIMEKARGEGRLDISSRPAGLPVTLWQLAANGDGARVPSHPRNLGTTPLKALPLAKGSYLLTTTASSGSTVRYPVYLEHGEHAVVHLVPPASCPEGMVFIPGGSFFVGGEWARHERLRRVPVPDFFMREKEVTFGEYQAFWEDPDGGNRNPDHLSRVLLSREARDFKDAWTPEGKLMAPLSPELPVVGVRQASAEKYCAWLGAKTGWKTRLPTALEWEKAARGTDGRNFVWGDVFNPSFAFTMENEAAQRRYAYLAPPGSFPADCSVYGVYDMGGNVREWTGSKFPEESPFYQIKGSSASLTKRFLYCAYSSDTPVAPSDVGFRYVMEP